MMDAGVSEFHDNGVHDRLYKSPHRRRRSHDETQPLMGPVSEDEAPRDYSSDDIEKRVLRKIDRTIIPILFITYMLNFMDKTILSSAAVFGLPEDNNLHGQQYSWVSSIFYIGYLTWTYPTTILIARLPTGTYLTANTIFWGTAVTLTSACHSFEGLMVARFLLGVAEATITPGFMFLTSTWYTRDEMPTRVGIWFAGNSVGGLMSSLLAFGVGTVGGRPWRWMYIILGAATLSWTVPMFFLLPDNISKAKFLTPEEREIAADRVAIAGTGSTENARWQWVQVKECLVDPKTWFIVAIELLTQIPNGGTQSFANLVVKSFGFTPLQTTLINVPYSLLSTTIIAGSGYLAGRSRRLNCILIALVITPCILGSSIIYHRDAYPPSLHLTAYFLLCTGPAAMPLTMALVQSNYRGVTKKMTMTALLFVAYCGGNVVGPQFFREEEAPGYGTAFRVIMVCCGLAVCAAGGLRGYLGWENGRRRTVEGVEGSASSTGGTGMQADGGDVTDWNMVGFRYRL